MGAREMNFCRLLIALLAAVAMAVAAGAWAQSENPRRLHIGANVQEAKRLKKVLPVYPAAALEAKISGTVVLKTVIAKDGSVTEATYVSGPQELADSAAEAVREWKYQVTLLQGQPVEVDSTVALVYQLSGSGGTVIDGTDQQPQEMPQQPIQRIRVGGNLMAKKMVKQVQPKYPKAAKKAGVQGTVILHVIIAKDGTVKELQYVSGPKELMQPAMDAVRHWVYEPTLFNGQPVEIDSTVSIIFNLGK
jgi:TonB family protein